jgi:hypothetical protein
MCDPRRAACQPFHRGGVFLLVAERDIHLCKADDQFCHSNNLNFIC